MDVASLLQDAHPHGPRRAISVPAGGPLTTKGDDAIVERRTGQLASALPILAVSILAAFFQRISGPCSQLSGLGKLPYKSHSDAGGREALNLTSTTLALQASPTDIFYSALPNKHREK